VSKGNVESCLLAICYRGAKLNSHIKESFSLLILEHCVILWMQKYYHTMLMSKLVYSIMYIRYYFGQNCYLFFKIFYISIFNLL